MARSSGRGRLTWVALAVAALGLTGTIQAVAIGGGVPFTARLTGTASWNFSLDTSPTFQGSGAVTHMGLAANEGVAYLEGLIETAACESGVGLPNVQTEILTAPNGDQLVVEIDDLACQDLVEPRRFHGNGVWQVISGTGRFANASGSGTMAGQADFAAGIFECTLIGEIAY